MVPTQISASKRVAGFLSRSRTFPERSILMRKVLLALFVMAAVVIGLGFYLKWFSLTPKGEEDNTNVPIKVNKEKIKTDVEKGKEKTKDLSEKGKEKVKDLTEKGKEKVKDVTDKGKGSSGGDNEKTKDATPASPAKEKDQ
jgi:hypothetical protein